MFCEKQLLKKFMNIFKETYFHIYIYSKNFCNKIDFNIEDINFINIELYYIITNILYCFNCFNCYNCFNNF